MTDDPRIRLLNRLYARKRKELKEREKLKVLCDLALALVYYTIGYLMLIDALLCMHSDLRYSLNGKNTSLRNSRMSR